MIIERSVEIERPVEDVFALVADPNNDPSWCPTVLESRQVEGDGPEVGARYEQVHRPGPAPATPLDVEILELDPPRRMLLKSTDDLGWFHVTYRLVRSESGTRLTQTSETHFHGFARLASPILWVLINLGVRTQFATLKRRLETPSRHPAEPRA